MSVLAKIIQDKISNIKVEYIDCSVNTKNECDIRCTNSYEIRYFEKGSFLYLIEGKAYEIKENSLLFLGNNVFLADKSKKEQKSSYYTISFAEKDVSIENKDAFTSFFDNNGGVMYYENLQHNFVADEFKYLMNTEPFLNDFQNEFLSFLLNIIDSVSVLEKYKPETAGNTAVSNIITYVNENLSSSLSLDFLAKEFYISKHHLNKVFRKTTGTTVGKFINYKRIVRAQNLIENGYSASRAAIESGFGDYSAFYRAYIKSLGHSPGEDKK